VQPLLALSLLSAAAAWVLPATAGAVGAAQQQGGQGSFDARSGILAAAPAAGGAPAQSLARKLGAAGVVAVDPVTGTPRVVARTDGTLTGPSGAPPSQVALDYVRAHPEVFKLTSDDIAALGAPQETVSPDGTHFLRWTQAFNGVPVVGADLRAAVAADGRLLEVDGSPLTDTQVPAGTAPQLPAASALARVRSDNGIGAATPRVTAAASGPQRSTSFADDSNAHLVVYAGPHGNRLAWSVDSSLDPDSYYSYVIDADSGAILKRDNLVRFDGLPLSSGGYVWKYAPGNAPTDRMPSGWRQQTTMFPSGWVAGADTPELNGNNAKVFADLNANGVESSNERVSPNNPFPILTYSWRFDVKEDDFTDNRDTGHNCSFIYPCSWASFADPGTYRDNLKQNATQAFWFVNNFHDYLARDPIGFNAASGNFQVGAAGGDDPLIVHTDDGANGAFTDGDNVWQDHPDGNHINDANMVTPPRGQQPVMNIFLFTAFGDNDPTIDGNGGDDASVVYHEYTHGLSSRLVADSNGVEALNAPQSAAMGEGWSDWYAMDYLTAQGLQADDPSRPGEVLVGAYLTKGSVGPLRTEALDCPVGQASPSCPRGGYTYADYGNVGAGPEAHADGEIWGQTLWDLRTALIRAHGQQAGDDDADGLVTKAMRLSPPEPSFLEMRDAILIADQDAGGQDHDLIWQVFARRGMGVYADSVTALDPAPVANFDVPPPAGTPTATLSGTVTDATTGAPVVGATVWLPGMRTAVATDGGGHYTIASALVASYPRLNVRANGYAGADPAPLTVSAGGSVEDVALRRDWALASGGAQVLGFTAPDLTAQGCGPTGAIDGTGGTGWGSYAPAFDGINGDVDGTFPDAGGGSRQLTVKLTQPVNVTSFEVDPGAVCGDNDGAALGAFTIETSPDGASWSTAVDLEGSSKLGSGNNHKLNALQPAPGVGASTQYVRLTMIAPQGGSGTDGAFFMDLGELGVYGVGVGGDNGPGPPPIGGPGPPRRAPAKRDRTKPRFLTAKLKLPKRHGLREFRGRKGVSLTLKASERARVTVTASLAAKTARSAGLTSRKRGTLVLASVKARWLKARKTVTLRVVPSRATSRRLAKVRSLTFTVTVKLTDTAGNVRTKRLRVKLRR
jgi:hypothetical protein